MSNRSAEDARRFLREKLSFAYAPNSPLLAAGWAAVAFDRNIHDSWAPDFFWDAFLRSVSERGDELISVADKSIVEKENENTDIVMISPKRAEMVLALMDQERFLRDQVIFGASRAWACLLDQDVTLFSGQADIMVCAINYAGGPIRVEQQMYSDFGVEKGRDTPINGYLARLTEGWRRAGLAW